MLQRILGFLALAVVVSGCATTHQNPPAVNELQTRVGDLEQQLKSKNEEVDSLKYEVKDLSYELDRMKMQSGKPSGQSVETSESSSQESSGKGSNEIIRVSATPNQVQTALKKAGYYKGVVDGKVGAKTKEAISRFQRDHGLKADGVIGKRTWDELKSHIE